MLTHAQIWSAIDNLAQRNGMSPSGLAKAAGLDPTTFNKSKRGGVNGKLRWPSTESVSKVLTATGASIEDFVALIGNGKGGKRSYNRSVPLIGMAQAGHSGFFDEAGFPVGHGWDEIPFPEIPDEHAYALEITGESMMPVYRDGDRIVLSPAASVRRGDRVVVKTTAGEVMAKSLARQTAQRVELKSFNPEFEDRAFAANEIVFMHRIIWASQ
ncbi:MAG: helix-turn-helix transcriptional regulator [Alphaproteobacteria bacterium]|nr:helix-turn-helix transcriptional regulator [Alphaproteobacteria bacterium]MBV9419622.1 helix-turn-helix transcriptional regulator [Alphaproteobacteria bacterium]MBV9541691.1 helix-turn-helix transcriptional regulator [Alphaproteobacteria bacterium]MBV9903448.1 helix-turn-helix transcriptional regulator [Alphaproteobacteria bacterium]